MFTKKQILSNTICGLLLSAASGVAFAADTYTMTNQRFDFRDASGSVTADGHQDVQASLINFTTKTGSLTTSTNFVGYAWNADIVNMKFYDGAGAPGAQAQTYTWDVQSWFIASVAVTCIDVPSFSDNCTDEAASGGTFLGTNTRTLTYNLSEGQFALELLFDWSTNADIPVVSIMEITNIASNGDITVASVSATGQVSDVAAAGAAGTPSAAADNNLFGIAMPNCPGCGPFPNQIPVFNGTLVKTGGDAVFSSQDTVFSANEDTVQTILKGDFTEATVFPTRVYTTANKALVIGAGSDYTTNGTSTVTTTLQDAGTLTVPVGLKLSAFTGSTSFNASLSVTNVNDAPTVSCSYAGSAALGDEYSVINSVLPVAVDVDGTITGFSFTSDAKLSAPTVPANTLPTGLSFNAATGAITGTPTVLGEASANLKIIATDNSAATGFCTPFTLTITGPNLAAPTMSTGTPTASVSQGSAYNFDVDCSDTDAGDSITYSFLGAGTTPPAWMSIDSSTGIISSAALTNTDVGTTTGIIVGCRDSAGQGSAADKTFSVAVLNVNDAPTITAGTCASATIAPGGSFSCLPAIADIDAGDSYTVAATGLPSWVSIDSATGAVNATSAATDSGVATIAITVTDAATATATLAAFTVTLNQSPVATGKQFSTPVNTELTGSLVDLVTDSEGYSPLVFSNAVTTTNATLFGGTVAIDINGGFIYTPKADFNGKDSFAYQAADQLSNSNRGTITIKVGQSTGETYVGSNFTMLNGVGQNASGGANDVVASWDGLYNTTVSDTDFSHMTFSSITPYFGELWTAHHIRVYGPGTYRFDATCTVADLEAGISDCSTNSFAGAQTERYITMIVGTGQIGAHILFDWSGNDNIDVVNVWDVNAEFNPGTVATTAGGALYQVGGDPT